MHYETVYCDHYITVFNDLQPNIDINVLISLAIEQSIWLTITDFTAVVKILEDYGSKTTEQYFRVP